MILYVICQLVCVIDSWAHMSFGAFNFILKIGCDSIKRGDPRLSGKLRKLYTTLLFTPRANSKVNKGEKH